MPVFRQIVWPADGASWTMNHYSKGPIKVVNGRVETDDPMVIEWLVVGMGFEELVESTDSAPEESTEEESTIEDSAVEDTVVDDDASPTASKRRK